MTETAEFPFTATIPAREKSKVAIVFEQLLHFRALSEEHGFLIPVSTAAKCLNVDRSRIDQLATAGKLVRVEIDGHVLIGGDSVIVRAREQRLRGRPRKST